MRGLRLLAADLLLVVEFALLASLAGPQPAGWIAAARYVGHASASNAGALAAGCVAALACTTVTVAAARRIDLTRTELLAACGREPARDAFEDLVAAVTLIVVLCFAVWLFWVAKPAFTPAR